MSVRGSWRVSLRIARRDVLRAKGRNILVALMIGIPVLLITGLSVLIATFDGDGTYPERQRLGSADARVTPVAREPVLQHPYLSYPDPAPADGSLDDERPWTAAEVADATGAKVVVVRDGSVLIRTELGALSAFVQEVDLLDDLTRDLAEVTDGRAPDRPGEVLVSKSLVERGFDLGSTAKLDNGKRVTVVGVVRNPADLKFPQLFALPDSVLDEDATTEFLVGGHPMSWAEVQKLNKLGLAVVSREVLDNPPSDAQIAPKVLEEHRQLSGSTTGLGAFIVVVGAVIVLEVVLLAGPAFAVGARRQSRQLALVVATGGTPKDVRRIVAAQAAVLGLGTAVVGCVLGYLTFVAGRPVIAQILGADLPPTRFDPLQLGGLVVVGALSAMAAALIPARQAAKQDTVAVLGGRRGEVRTTPGLPIVGVVLFALGVAVVLFSGLRAQSGEYGVVLGTFALVGGAILVIPAVVGLVGRLARHLPLALRLAARDTSRHRSRTTPAVAAIMGTVTGVTALAVASFSDLAEQRRDYQPGAEQGAMEITLWDVSDSAAQEVLRVVEGQLPGRVAALSYYIPEYDEEHRGVRVVVPGCESDSPMACIALDEGGSMEWQNFVVATPEVLAREVGHPLTAAQTKALTSGGVLVPDKEALTAAGTAQVETYATESAADGSMQRTDQRRTSLPAAVLDPVQRNGREKVIIPGAMTKETAERIGLKPVPNRVLVPPTDVAIAKDEQARLAEVVTGIAPNAQVYVERGYDDPIALYYFLLLAGIGGLIVLVGTATATALALDDAKPDFATLAAIGASPGTRRVAAMGQAAVIASLGGVLGVATGLLPGLAMTWPLTEHSQGGHIVDVPWSLLAIVVVGVPVLAILGAGVFTRSRLPLVRRAE